MGIGEFHVIPVDEIGGVFDGKVVSVGETAAVARIPEIYGGSVNDPYDFSFVKLVFKAQASVAKNVTISLTDATTSPEPIQLSTEMAEYVKYFRISDT